MLKQATYSYMASQLVSKEEKDRIADSFKPMDRDGSGTLDRRELQAGYEQNGIYLDEDELDQIFASADIDGSGKVDYTEFVAAALENNKLINENMLEQAFKFFDADSSGKISQDNLKEVLGFCSIEMISQADLDGDNQVDFSEFKKMMNLKA